MPKFDAPTGSTIAPESDGAVDRALRQGPGFLVRRNAVPDHVVDRAMRLLNLEIATAGLTPEDIERCARGTFFPHLRWEAPILAVREHVESLLRPRDDEGWADSQILLRFPDAADEWPLTPHVDELPPWAQDRTYRAIAGVALSRSTMADGCLVVWPRSHAGAKGEPVAVELQPGDVVVMHPDLEHCGALNRGGHVRYALYFRLLR